MTHNVQNIAVRVFFAGVNGTALSARTERQKEHCPFCPYNTRKKNMTAIFSLSVYRFIF